jgi:hypothetical protein
MRTLFHFQYGKLQFGSSSLNLYIIWSFYFSFLYFDPKLQFSRFRSWMLREER